MYQYLQDLLHKSLERIQADRDVPYLTNQPYTIALKDGTTAIRYWQSGRYNFSGTWEDATSFDSNEADDILARVSKQTGRDLEVVTVIALRDRTEKIHTEILEALA